MTPQVPGPALTEELRCKHRNPLGACPKCLAIAALPRLTPRQLEREKDVQLAVARIYSCVGFDVTNLSQVRASMVRCGIGDLFLMRKGLVAWHETKLDGGEQSTYQEAFEASCRRHGIPYIIGGRYEAYRWLESVGLWRLPAGRAWESYAEPTALHRESERIARREAGALRAPATLTAETRWNGRERRQTGGA